jgi:peroxiredoxin (alkyl hydroperoxide reductase subunit C)
MMDEMVPMIGDEFPQMDVQTTKGVLALPEHFEGKWFVLFSHPADFTPVCTTEFVAFQKRADKFRELNCELIGLSIDQVFSHIKWVEWIRDNLQVNIEFPIIADDCGEVADTLGLIHPSSGSNTVRAVFIIDVEGVIRSFLYYPQECGRNVDEILRMVKALQTTDAKGVACPANWPDNELVGDHVIVPPASNVEDAKKNAETYENFDWWFCHKSL